MGVNVLTLNKYMIMFICIHWGYTNLTNTLNYPNSVVLTKSPC